MDENNNKISKKRSNLKILLMQIRDDKVTQQEELDEFIRYGKLNKDQIDVLDVFKTPNFDVSVINGYDALFVGGSSDASVMLPDKYIFVDNCKKLINYCFDNNIATFASCFGFQLAVEALGSEVYLDKEKMEMGTYQISLTEQASSDILFCDIPDGFMAVSGHKEHAKNLPKGAILLAYSELCPYHAITFKDKPFYAFQFHPEVDRRDLINRITRYRDRYLDKNNALQNIIDNSKETTEANSLISKFIDKVML